MNKNEQYSYGKVVDDLTVEELIEYDNNNVHILLVRNKVSDEVREVAKGTFVFIYDGLDEKKDSASTFYAEKYERRWFS